MSFSIRRSRSLFPRRMPKSMFRRRPLGVTLLLWLVLSLTVWGAVRLIAALRFWNLLNEFESRLSSWYLFLTGAGWVALGAVLLWGLFSGRLWTARAILVSIALWIVQYWIERIFFQAPRANISFAIFVTLLLFIVTLVSAFNRKTKEFLIRSEEHEQPDQYSDIA
jgi:hypothetical protein